MMRGTFPGATFGGYVGVFEIPQPRRMAPRLREILDEFGEQGRNALFSMAGDVVIGFWVDPFHNYLAIAFKKTTGDEFDGDMVLSIGG